MNRVEITVDGGYRPSEVKVKVGEPVKLVFNRISDKGCLDQLNIPALNVKQQDLPLNETQEFDLDTSKAGEIDFVASHRRFERRGHAGLFGLRHSEYVWSGGNRASQFHRFQRRCL